MEPHHWLLLRYLNYSAFSSSTLCALISLSPSCGPNCSAFFSILLPHALQCLSTVHFKGFACCISPVLAAAGNTPKQARPAMSSQSLRCLWSLWIWARSRHGGGEVEGFSPFHLWEVISNTGKARGKAAPSSTHPPQQRAC